MTTAKKPAKPSKTTSTKKKAPPQSKEVLKPRKGVEKISDDRLEEITGGKVEGWPGVAWAVDRS